MLCILECINVRRPLQRAAFMWSSGYGSGLVTQTMWV